MSILSAEQGVARGLVPAAQRLRYLARQPIFDRQEKVFGYELLFRDGLENAFSGDLDEASRVTLDRSLLIGLDVLCDGRRAFVNCTRDTLLKGLVTLLPATSTVVEVLETVPADPEVVAACRSLKDAGYMIALDDYVANDPREGLAELADIIKVEMLLTTEEERTGLMKRLGAGRCRMLAEKIETNAEFMRARDQGFVYFQGYFFRRPEMMIWLPSLCRASASPRPMPEPPPVIRIVFPVSFIEISLLRSSFGPGTKDGDRNDRAV